LVLPPIEPLCDLSRDDAIKKMTEMFNELLECFVKKHPEQWLWLHRRWRS